MVSKKQQEKEMITDLAFKAHLRSKLTGERVPLMDPAPVTMEAVSGLESMENIVGQRYRAEMRLYFEQTFRNGLRGTPLEYLDQRAERAIQRMLFGDVASELRTIQIMIWEQQQPVAKEINDRIENLFNVLTR